MGEASPPPDPARPLARPLRAPASRGECTPDRRPRRHRRGAGSSTQRVFLTRGRSLEIGKKRRLKLSATSTAWSGGGGSSCGSEPRADPPPAPRRAVPRAAIAARGRRRFRFRSRRERQRAPGGDTTARGDASRREWGGNGAGAGRELFVASPSSPSSQHHLRGEDPP